MRLNDFLQGITILQKYYNNPNGFHLGADHDVIYLYGTDSPLTEEDFKRLTDLGWTQFGWVNTDNDYSLYNAEESWVANI